MRPIVPLALCLLLLPAAHAQTLSIEAVDIPDGLRPGESAVGSVDLLYSCDNPVANDPNGYVLELQHKEAPEALHVESRGPYPFTIRTCLDGPTALTAEVDLHLAGDAASDAYNVTLEYRVHPQQDDVPLVQYSNAVVVQDVLANLAPPEPAAEPEPLASTEEAPGPALPLLALGALAVAAARRRE